MLINEKVPLEFKYVNKLLSDNLLEYLKKKFEGKCCEQGYVKPESIKIVNYSSGIVKNNLIVFEVVFESLVCYLVEGVEINCIAKNITKAGIRCELDMDKTPVIIFVARDHHYTNKMFSEVKEGLNITVKIIGQRYELNDTNISAIAELVKVNKNSKKLQIESSTSDTQESIEKDKKLKKNDEGEEPDDSQVDESDEVQKKQKDEPVVDEPGETQEKLVDESQPDESQPDESQPDVPSKEVLETKSKKEETQEQTQNIVNESSKSKTFEETGLENKIVEKDKDLNTTDDNEALEALEALEKLDKESELLKEKEVTIVEDTGPPKRKRGRPKKIN